MRTQLKKGKFSSGYQCQIEVEIKESTQILYAMLTVLIIHNNNKGGEGRHVFNINF